MAAVKPRLLDLFCCAGGASRGYQLAGFHVTGVDLDARPDYIGDEFHQADAVEFARKHAHRFDFVHASPPCQGFSYVTPGPAKGSYPNLIGAVREALDSAGVPYVLENVVGAVKKGPMRRDLSLCGEMFGLRVIRHRVFETGGWAVEQPKHLPHRGLVRGAGRPGRSGHKGSRDTRPWYYYGVHGHGTGAGVVADWSAAMGIDWMTNRHDLAEALPPAYTRYIGSQFLNLGEKTHD